MIFDEIRELKLLDFQAEVNDIFELLENGYWRDRLDVQNVSELVQHLRHYIGELAEHQLVLCLQRPVNNMVQQLPERISALLLVYWFLIERSKFFLVELVLLNFLKLFGVNFVHSHKCQRKPLLNLNIQGKSNVGSDCISVLNVTCGSYAGLRTFKIIMTSTTTVNTAPDPQMTTSRASFE